MHGSGLNVGQALFPHMGVCPLKLNLEGRPIGSHMRIKHLGEQNILSQEAVEPCRQQCLKRQREEGFQQKVTAYWEGVRRREAKKAKGNGRGRGWQKPNGEDRDSRSIWTAQAGRRTDPEGSTDEIGKAASQNANERRETANPTSVNMLIIAGTGRTPCGRAVIDDPDEPSAIDEEQVVELEVRPEHAGGCGLREFRGLGGL